jgi:hypothetical protein
MKRPGDKIKAAADTRVLKKIAPGQPGSKSLLAKYGDRLLCVRYRECEASKTALTTVELIVDERAIPEWRIRTRSRDDSLVGVHVGYPEAELRARVKAAGAKWDSEACLWRMPRSLAQTLGLVARVREW